jgi:hypothetical protein
MISFFNFPEVLSRRLVLTFQPRASWHRPAFSAVVDAFGDPILTKDPGGKMLSWNQG